MKNMTTPNNYQKIAIASENVKKQLQLAETKIQELLYTPNSQNFFENYLIPTLETFTYKGIFRESYSSFLPYHDIKTMSLFDFYWYKPKRKKAQNPTVLDNFFEENMLNLVMDTENMNLSVFCNHSLCFQFSDAILENTYIGLAVSPCGSKHLFGIKNYGIKDPEVIIENSLEPCICIHRDGSFSRPLYILEYTENLNETIKKEGNKKNAFIGYVSEKHVRQYIQKGIREQGTCALNHQQFQDMFLSNSFLKTSNFLFTHTINKSKVKTTLI